MPWRVAAWGVVAIAACIVAFYLVPSLIEWRLAELAGPFPVMVVGDLAGCAVIAMFASRRRGAALYAVLTAIEVALYLKGILPIRTLIWVTDAVPTLILCAFVGAALASILADTVALDRGAPGRMLTVGGRGGTKDLN